MTLDYRQALDDLNARIPPGYVEPWWTENSHTWEDLILDDGTVDPDFTLKTGAGGLVAWYAQLMMERLQAYFDSDECSAETEHQLRHEFPYGGAERWVPKYGDEFSAFCVDISPLTVVHAGALVDLITKIGLRAADIRSVVMWGGSFGSQSRILRLLQPDVTEYVIDLPIASILQYDYLRHVFGDDRAQLIVNDDDPLIEHGTNLVPLPNLHRIPRGHDVFIATHSLNESPVDAQRYIVEHNWFDARYLDLAYGPNPSFSMESHDHFDRLFRELCANHPSEGVIDDGWTPSAQRGAVERIIDRGAVGS